MNGINEKIIASLMNNMRAKILKSISIMSNSNKIFYKYLTVISLIPILSFEVTIMHITNDKSNIRLILFINSVVLFYNTLFLFH